METNQVISEHGLRIIQEIQKEKQSLTLEELRNLKLELIKHRIESGEYEVDEEALSLELLKHFELSPESHS